MLKTPISLGFLCDSRSHISNHYKLCKDNGYLTCPFDLMTSNYKGVIDCINDDFKDFFDVELKKIYGTDEFWIYNKKYKFLFNHESPGHAELYIRENWQHGINHFIENNYENFILRYQTRINNFRNYLNSGNHIIFVIHRFNNNIDDLSELTVVIHAKYPNLSFEFDLLQDYNYERIYCHQLMMGFDDNDIYNECKRFNHKQLFDYLHNDYNHPIFKNFQDENLKLNNNELKMKFLIYYLFKNMENNTIIYSLKSFYEKYPIFNYYLFRKLHSNELENFTEEETIIHWYNNYYKLNKDDNLKTDDNLNSFHKDVIIYPHYSFDLVNGGVTVQYYLAKILDKLGIRVRIININGSEKNIIFNNVFCNDFNINDCVVIYCEGVQGNPLNAKHVVRWMLSPLGKNVPYDWVNTWGKNELVYYFNPEPRFIDKIGSIYKLLTCPYINPNIVNYNKNERNGTCFSYRKSNYHKIINQFHNPNDFEINRNHNQEDYINIFNKHKYFILYDPLSFLMTISTMCGCITIIHPVEGLSKLEWLHTTFYSFYLKSKNLDNIFGIAYGMEDISYAENTIHLAYNQMKDIEQCFIENSIIPFVNDMKNFEQMENTLEKNYY